MNITIKDLNAVRSKLRSNFVSKTLYQIHTIKMWQLMRDNTCFCFAKWTDSELKNHDENGFIGKKCGIDCYVPMPINIK